MRKIFVWALAFAVLSSVVAIAGDEKTADTSGVPKIIRVSIADVKPGKMETYTSTIRQIRSSADTNKAVTRWVAASPIVGNTNEVSFVSFFDNYAAIEEHQSGLEKAVWLARTANADHDRNTADSSKGMRRTIAELRPSYSYRLERLDLANARRWKVTVMQFRPGFAGDYLDALKEGVEAHKRANIDEHWATYQVTAGAPDDTYYLVESLNSFAELDRDLGEAHKDAISTSLRQRIMAAIRNGVVHMETQIYSVNPELSRPPEQFIAANPALWTIKEQPVLAKTKKQQKSGLQAASIQEETKSPK
jgi:hypothetical protein